MKKVWQFISSPFRKIDDVFKGSVRSKPKTVLLILVSVVSLFNVDAAVLNGIKIVGEAVIQSIENPQPDGGDNG